MLKEFRWRLFICVVPVLLALWIVAVAWRNYANDSATGLRFNLGVDLAGGTILVYEVDRDWYERQTDEQKSKFDSTALASALKKRIDPNNLREITIRPVETVPPRVEIILPIKSAAGNKAAEADIEAIKSIIRQVGNLEFRLLADTRPRPDGGDDNQAIKDAEALLKDYVPSEKGVPDSPDSSVYQWVQLSADAVKEQVKDGRWAPDLKGFHKSGTIAFYHAPSVNRHFVLTRRTVEGLDKVVGEDIRARPGMDNFGKPIVQFEVIGGAAARMQQLTKPVGHLMAIILDERVESWAELKANLSTSGQIEMYGEKVAKKVDDLVRILRAGALPATLSREPASELTMGPGLGADTIEAGKNAVVFSFFAVLGFMVVYYRFAGFVASVALFANLFLTIAFMVLVKATFTLPGIAGLVLTVGMAVDANVLIYERIREERERGSNLLMAIRNGYDRAFATIIDTHLTSIFTAIVLYAVGNDQLKGFGVSLTAGLVISLFTSLYMTRLMFDLWQVKGWLKNLRMMKMLTKPKIDFMAIRNYWFAATVILSLLGIGLVWYRGSDALNIDFTGGTAYSVEFREAHDIGTVRERISERMRNPDGTQAPVTVDEIYGGQEEEGKRFTLRTTLRDAEGRFDPKAVRKIVSDTFGEDLVWIRAQASEVEPVPAAKEGDPERKRFRLEFNEPVAEGRVSGAINEWFTRHLPDVKTPDYKVEGTGEATSGGLYKTLIVTFALPEVDDAAKPPPDLKGWVIAELNQPKSERLENFDSQLAGETQLRALYAIGLSWVAVLMYLWFRFGNWTFGLAAVLCLIHDLFFAIGLIAVCHYFAGTFFGNILLLQDFKIDLPAVAALLTLVGYSVNDTIVVFDRIREVRGKSPDLTPQMINDSINQTLSRTLLTGISTMLAVIVLYIWGGDGVHLFSYIMIVGVVIGTYSSIYVASPLLLIFGEGKQAELRRKLQTQEAAV